MTPNVLSTERPHDVDFELVDAYWRAANYLSAGQIYLLGNPLLREPLRLVHIKPRLLGHWVPPPRRGWTAAAPPRGSSGTRRRARSRGSTTPSPGAGWADNVFMDEHLIDALLIVGLALVSAGDTLGLGRWWAGTRLVERFPVLK